MFPFSSILCFEIIWGESHSKQHSNLYRSFPNPPGIINSWKGLGEMHKNIDKMLKCALIPTIINFLGAVLGK